MCKIIISSISECVCSSEGAVEGIETAGTKNQNEPVGHALHFAILELVTSPIYSYGLLVAVVDISSAVEERCSPAKFRSPYPHLLLQILLFLSLGPNPNQIQYKPALRVGVMPMLAMAVFRQFFSFQ